MEVRVSNLIAVMRIRKQIDFEWLSKRLPGKRGGKRFPGYITRFNDATLLIFRNGKIVIVGARDFKQLDEIRRWAKEFFSLTKLPRIQISNMVVSVDFRKRVDLLKLVPLLSPHIRYDPEIFPGATIYHDGYPGMAILLFTTGKAIITGSASIEEINNLVSWLKGLVERFSS